MIDKCGCVKGFRNLRRSRFFFRWRYLGVRFCIKKENYEHIKEKAEIILPEQSTRLPSMTVLMVSKMSRAQQLVITGLTPDNLLSKIAWSFAAKLSSEPDNDT